MDRKSLFLRFPVGYRIEHWILAINFSILAVTGLVQFFATSPVSHAIIGFLGGVENVRHIHHFCAVLLIIEALVHIGVVRYRGFMTLAPNRILPNFDDAKNALMSFAYNFGLTKNKPKEGRFTFAEKAEYWAVIWGTILMALTGFMMWNPVATTRWLPGEFIPAAKVAHGLEAILAVGAIIIWHFYFVLIKRLNLSMFTGYVTEEEMEEEHPLELADIRMGIPKPRIDEHGAERYWKHAFPPYFILSIIIVGWVIWFAYFEQTSIEKIMPPEDVTVFAPTEEGIEFRGGSPTIGEFDVRDMAWETGIDEIIELHCGSCHAPGGSGGHDFTDYDYMLDNGLVIPGDPDGSPLISTIEPGDHPGRIAPCDLAILHIWIAHGAPETVEDYLAWLEGEEAEVAPEETGEEVTGDEEQVPVRTLTWASGIGDIFAESCTSCHGAMALGGLNLASYQAAMDSGSIVPGDSESSSLIRKMETGTHPATLHAADLDTVRQWIDAGAPSGDIPATEPEVEEPEEEPVEDETEVVPVEVSEEESEIEVDIDSMPDYFWDSDIAYIFENRCTSCHGQAAMGGYDFRTYDFVADSDLVVPGDPDASPLMLKVEVELHPGTLTSEEISILRAWIWKGARYSESGEPEEEQPEESAIEEVDVEEPAEADEASEVGEDEEVQEEIMEEPVEEAPVEAYTWSEVFQILEGTCTGCHGANAMGGLDLTGYGNLIDTGVVVPGDPDGSSLVTTIRDGGHFAQLSEDEIRVLIEWITSGAPRD